MNCKHTGRRQSKTPILSRNVNQKPLETEFSIAICRHTVSLDLGPRLSIRGQLYSKFSFGEKYRRVYGRKISFTATREWSRKT